MTLFDKQIYYRLIALWAVCEAMLGGIIHGFKLPVSGLVVGSCAVICICLIGYYVPQKGAIIKATIIVAVFKMMLSPHSPPAAYFAVFFQGIIGEILFLNRKFYKTSCLLLGILALAESGIQRILVMTILFGMDFWKAVNDFINGLTHQERITNYSFYIAGGYVVLHIIVGALVGWFAGKIPSILKNNRDLIFYVSTDVNAISNKKHLSGKRKIKTGLLIVWIILLFLFLQSAFNIGEPILSPDRSLQILIRSILIVLTWYFLISPLLMNFLKKWLQKQKTKSQKDIHEILLLLPFMQMILQKSWQLSSGKKGIKRLNMFCKLVLVNSLRSPDEP